MKSAPQDPAREKLDQLYAGPLEGFVARRNELAKELALAGAKEAAARVKALPKPVATAWVVNRLAQEEAASLTALRAAGDELRRAQARGDREALRRASEERHELVGTLVERAGELLREGGHQDSIQARQRIRRTLEAIAAYGSSAALDPPPGRLHEDVEPPGFETLLGLAGGAPPTPVPRAAPRELARSRRAATSDSAATAAAKKAAASRRLELQRAATVAAELVEEARAAAREAEAERERATRRAEDAERAAARQEERLRQARTARDEAAAQRRVAEREAAVAAKALEKRRAELAAAQGRLRDLA